jgi:hypothetical protein
MSLDIRIPIGLMFGIFGLILAGYGFYTLSDSSVYEHSLGINVNLIWGWVLLAFSLIMLGLARRASRKAAKAEATAKKT